MERAVRRRGRGGRLLGSLERRELADPGGCRRRGHGREDDSRVRPAPGWCGAGRCLPRGSNLVAQQRAGLVAERRSGAVAELWRAMRTDVSPTAAFMF